MRILALDPATKTGWAHSAGPSGVWDFKVLRDESGGMRLIRLKSKLGHIIESVGIDLVVFEAARNAAPKMQNALVIQAELQSVIKTFCEERAINYRGYSPSEIKTFATGKGNANKDLMVKKAQQTFTNIKIIDDNHADALFLLHLAMKEYA